MAARKKTARKKTRAVTFTPEERLRLKKMLKAEERKEREANLEDIFDEDEPDEDDDDEDEDEDDD